MSPGILSEKAKAKRLKKIKKFAELLAAEKQKERLKKEEIRTNIEEELRILNDCGHTPSDRLSYFHYNATFFGIEGWDDM